jgi:hypothetical protein
LQALPATQLITPNSLELDAIVAAIGTEIGTDYVQQTSEESRLKNQIDKGALACISCSYDCIGYICLMHGRMHGRMGTWVRSSTGGDVQ